LSESEGAQGDGAKASPALVSAKPGRLSLRDEPVRSGSEVQPVAGQRSVLGGIQTMVSGAVFVAAVGLGIVLFGAGNPSARPSPFPPATTVAEPPSAARLVHALSGDDAGTLAASVDSRILQSLDGSLNPIVHVTEVRFLGAVSLGSDTVVAYLVRGKDTQGQKIVRGFALHVQGDRVVGVN
jgi:hypothetical protein